MPGLRRAKSKPQVENLQTLACRMPAGLSLESSGQVDEDPLLSYDAPARIGGYTPHTYDDPLQVDECALCSYSDPVPIRVEAFLASAPLHTCNMSTHASPFHRMKALPLRAQLPLHSDAETEMESDETSWLMPAEELALSATKMIRQLQLVLCAICSLLSLLALFIVVRLLETDGWTRRSDFAVGMLREQVEEAV